MRRNKTQVIDDSEDEGEQAKVVLGKRDSKGNSINKTTNVVDQLPPVSEVPEVEETKQGTPEGTFENDEE